MDGESRQKTSPLLEGAYLRRALDGMQAKIVDQVARLMGKMRTPPEVRIDDFIAAQRSSHVRESIAALMKGRKWTFVSFAEFSQRLTIVIRALLSDLVKHRDEGPVCFVIDNLSKSSFWVLAMSLLVLADKEFKTLFKARRVTVAVDNNGAGGGVRTAFQQLHANINKRPTLIFVDDAVYSGEQLSYFCGYSKLQWTDMYPNGPIPRIIVAVPFVATSAVHLFKSYELRCAVKFKSLFYRRTVASSLRTDLFIVRPQIISSFTTFQSLYFDFLGVKPTNTLMLFEHKIADALSIPHRWLKTGPCVPPEVRTAYRVKPDMAQQLADAVQTNHSEQDRLFVFAPPGSRAPPPHQDAAMKVLQLMQSAKFRNTYMERVTLTSHGSHGKWPLFYPLLPPEYCEARYRKFAARLEESSTAIAMGMIPDCIRPPYKRSGFRDHVRELRW